MLPDDPWVLKKQLESYKMRCELLEVENEYIRGQISLLRATTLNLSAKIYFGLTGSEFIIFNQLMKHQTLTREKLLHELYFDIDDAAEEKIIDVFVCKLRAKLKTYSIKIETVRGEGYFIPLEDKEKARRCLLEFKIQDGI